MKPPAAREIMAFSVVALFVYAYAQNPHDQTIVGALIAAFAGAWGFYLGGSKVGSDTAEKNADQLRGQATGFVLRDGPSTGAAPHQDERSGEVRP